METATTPPSPPDRIITLDILRGAVLLGILIVNMAGFALPFDALNNPLIGGVYSPVDHHAWYLTDLLVSNSMRGIFSMLFGASLILLTAKLEQNVGVKAAKTYFFRRNMWLLIFGLFHGYIMLMPGDVLYFYAVTGFLLYYMRNLKPRTLIILALCIFAGRMAFEAARYFSLRQLIDLAATHGGIYADLLHDIQQEHLSDPVQIQKEIGAITQGYGATFRLFAPYTFLIQTYGYLTDLVWDVASMMLLGMALYKSGILQGERNRRFYLLLMVISYFIGVGVNAATLAHLQHHQFDLISQQLQLVTFDVSRAALALGHMSLIILITTTPILPRLKHALAAVGRMALSNYLMQTLICIFLFYGFGFGLFNSLGRADLFGVIVAIWAAQLVMSSLWLQYHQYGPMEWLWRCLTFREIKPLKKSPSPADESPCIPP
ncbi:DUF418 domain-containing protein [Paremcibacter congregatus]|uniref:DUF418 domain-containing protein n=1 Tax=Paremcibacter congregatus TaxID=2043170 RepID=UPI0030EEF04C|tara:strand:+ start:5779 stop:7074 length:1296 start_codon:yes stop_codon:yes gene_type:complete